MEAAELDELWATEARLLDPHLWSLMTAVLHTKAGQFDAYSDLTPFEQLEQLEALLRQLKMLFCIVFV